MLIFTPVNDPGISVRRSQVPPVPLNCVADGSNPICPPWDNRTYPESMRKFEMKLLFQFVKIVVPWIWLRFAR
jgi:hypothetical protein